MITALCGGVGGSKLALGLYRTLPADSLTIVVNTADDLDFCGLHVSPDLDTVMYTLAGLSRRDVGWGIEGDTFEALTMLERYGAPTWFSVGDSDLATDIFRTHALGGGWSLTRVTDEMAARLNIRARLLPMTDARVSTRLSVNGEWLDFQDYFVRHRHQVPVDAIRYEGADSAHATDEVRGAIRGSDVVVIVNSNPVLSIMPALSLKEMRRALDDTSAVRVAVSPFIGSDAVTGPAGDLMRLVDLPPTSAGVAHLYHGLVDGIVIHQDDQVQARAIESLGIAVLCVDTIMKTDVDRGRLARQTIDFAHRLR
ncbi:MAG: 2-phospho-L-lactate transferase [Chloroflexota bacterium]